MTKKIIIDMDSLEEIDISEDQGTESENSMSNLSAVKNVEVSIDANKLLKKVKLDEEFGKTKRGKTQIATTRGNKFYKLSEETGLGCALSLTVYKD